MWEEGDSLCCVVVRLEDAGDKYVLNADGMQVVLPSFLVCDITNYVYWVVYRP